MGAWFFTPFLTRNSKGRAPLVWMRPCTRAREQETPPKGEDFPDVSHWGVDKWPLAQKVQTGWWPHPGTQGAPCSVCTVPPEPGPRGAPQETVVRGRRLRGLQGGAARGGSG